MSQGLPMLIVLPLAGGLLSLAIPSGRRFRAALLTAVLGSMSLLTAQVLVNSFAGEIQVHAAGNWPPGFGLGLAADLMGSVMLSIVLGLAAACLTFSFGELEGDGNLPRFQCAFLFLVAGLNGMILTTDLFNLFVFVEVASVSAYVLVAYFGGEEELEASLKYMVLGTLSSFLFLAGIAMLYDQVGSLNLGAMAVHLASGESNGALEFSVLLVLIGLAMPAAIFPLHVWLADAHSRAPSAVSAMLSGASVQTAVFAMVRVFHHSMGPGSVGILDILPWAGLATALLGAFAALGQRDIKRLLAYTTVSSGGLSVLLLSLGSAVGFKSFFLHMINHASAKALLFFSAACLIKTLSLRDFEEMGNAWSAVPSACVAFIIGAVADFGGPSLGFLGKSFMFLGLLEESPVYVGGAAIAVIVVAVSYLRVIQSLLGGGAGTAESARVLRLPTSMSGSMFALTLACIVFGLASWALLGMAERVAGQVMDTAVMISAFLGI